MVLRTHGLMPPLQSTPTGLFNCWVLPRRCTYLSICGIKDEPPVSVSCEIFCIKRHSSPLVADEPFVVIKAAANCVSSAMESAEVTKCLGPGLSQSSCKPASICHRGSAGAQVSSTAAWQRVKHGGCKTGVIGVTWEERQPCKFDMSMWLVEIGPQAAVGS